MACSFVLFWVLLFSYRVLFSLNWPQNFCVAKDDSEAPVPPTSALSVSAAVTVDTKHTWLMQPWALNPGLHAC